MANDLVGGAVEAVLDAVVDKTFVEEEPLPAEAELARFLRVSRPTMREAVRNLSMGGVLNVVHGRGTFLLPRFRWRELRYLMYVAAHEGRVLEVELDSRTPASFVRFSLTGNTRTDTPGRCR